MPEITIESAIERLIFQIKKTLPNPQKYFNFLSGVSVAYVLSPKSFKNLKSIMRLMKADLAFGTVQLVRHDYLIISDFKIIIYSTDDSEDLIGQNLVGGVMKRGFDSDFFCAVTRRIKSRGVSGLIEWYE